MSRPRFSLNLLVLSSLTIVLLLAWLLIGTIVLKTSQNDRFRQKGETARGLLSFFCGVASAVPGDVAALKTLAAPLSAEKDFAGLCVLDASGNVLLGAPTGVLPDPVMFDMLKRELKPAIRFGDEVVYAYAPLIIDGHAAGVARLALSLRSERERLKDTARLFTSYFILDSLLLLLVGSYLMSRLVLRPLNRLGAATGRIAEGDLGCRVPVAGATEVAEMAASFNAMTDALRRKQREVELYVVSVEEASKRLQAAHEETLRSEKLASVGLLAAGTAHEIGSPLAAIIGYADLLEHEPGDAESADYARRIGREARRIDTIVRGLLQYARPSNPLVEAVAVAEVLEEVLDILRAQGVLKKIEVHLESPAGVPAVRADRNQLLQVFVNLILNARDAMPDGGRLEISVQPLGGAETAGRAGDGKVAIRISDSGTGIPTENLERIFDPFFTTKDPGKGTGLGLSICARILESFGGTICAESRQGGGATFIMTVPAVGGRGEGESD
ncbi:MAG TPA: ATP-binding protein [Verrucomicrobiae bacterium]|nr:ATP-binding protein [Verrucomicrobiae bacterium]